jgi:hypothetical protein
MDDTAAPAPAAEATAGDDAQPDMSAIVAELDAADAGQPAAAPAEGETPAAEPAPAPVAAKPADDLNARRARRILAEAERKERGAALSLAQFKQQLAAKMRDNPDAGLAELGLDTDALIDAKVAGKGDKPKTIEEKFAELQKRFDDAESERKTAKVAQELEQAKANRRSDIAAFGDKYPRLNCANAEKAAQRRDVAIDFMIEYHAKHGVPLPVEKAAQMTNDFFDDAGGSDKPASPAAVQALSAPRAAAPTLTNTGAGGSGPAPDESGLDEDALYERALAEINRM